MKGDGEKRGGDGRGSERKQKGKGKVEKGKDPLNLLSWKNFLLRHWVKEVMGAL